MWRARSKVEPFVATIRESVCGPGSEGRGEGEEDAGAQGLAAVVRPALGHCKLVPQHWACSRFVVLLPLIVALQPPTIQ